MTTTTISYVILDDKTNFPVEVCFSEDLAKKKLHTLREANGNLGPRHSFRIVPVSTQDPVDFVNEILDRQLVSEIVEESKFDEVFGNAMQSVMLMGRESFIDAMRRFDREETGVYVVEKNKRRFKKIGQLMMEEE